MSLLTAKHGESGKCTRKLDYSSTFFFSDASCKVKLAGEGSCDRKINGRHVCIFVVTMDAGPTNTVLYAVHIVPFSLSPSYVHCTHYKMHVLNFCVVLS